MKQAGEAQVMSSDAGSRARASREHQEDKTKTCPKQTNGGYGIGAGRACRLSLIWRCLAPKVSLRANLNNCGLCLRTAPAAESEPQVCARRQRLHSLTQSTAARIAEPSPPDHDGVCLCC